MFKMAVPITVMVLRSIDPREVLQKYISGGFSNNSHEKVIVRKADIVQFHNFNESNSSYTYKDSTGKPIRIRTSGCITNKTQYCLWCKKQLDDDDVLGIPLRMEKEDDKIYFCTTGRICSLKCGLAFVHLIMRDSSQIRIVYKESENLLHLMHKELGRTGELSPAIGFWHLEQFGGSYTYEDFSKEEISPSNTINMKCYKFLHFSSK